MVIMAVLIGFYDGDPMVGLTVGAVGLAILYAVIVIATRITGRRQLSWLALDGDLLLARRVHHWDRGELLRMKLAEIGNWQTSTRRYKHETYSEIGFEHAGRPFWFYLSEDGHPDLDLIEAMVPESAGKAELRPSRRGGMHKAE